MLRPNKTNYYGKLLPKFEQTNDCIVCALALAVIMVVVRWCHPQTHRVESMMMMMIIIITIYKSSSRVECNKTKKS